MEIGGLHDTSVSSACDWVDPDSTRWSQWWSRYNAERVAYFLLLSQVCHSSANEWMRSLNPRRPNWFNQSLWHWKASPDTHTTPTQHPPSAHSAQQVNTIPPLFKFLTRVKYQCWKTSKGDSLSLPASCEILVCRNYTTISIGLSIQISIEFPGPAYLLIEYPLQQIPVAWLPMKRCNWAIHE